MTAKKRYWIESGFLSILQNFSGVFFGFASFFLLVRSLDNHSFGAWVLFMSTTTIVEAIRNGLIQTALIRYVSSGTKEDHPRIVAASLLLGGIVTLLVIAAGLPGAPYLAELWKTPELSALFRVYALGFAVSLFLSLFNCVEQANLRFRGVFVTGLIRQFLFFAFVAVSFLIHHQIELVELVWVQVASIMISTVFAYFYTRAHFRLRFEHTGYWMKRLFGYGKYGFGTSVSSLLSGTIDQMMLGAMLSPAASGAFNIAVRITNLIDIPTNAMAAIVFPQSAKRMTEGGKDAVKYLYEKSVGTTLAILLPGVLFLYFFADWVIWAIAGQKYADSIPLLKVTLLYSLLIPFGRQFGTILDSVGKTRITFLVVLFTTAVNLGLNFILIRQIGVMGAAYATLCSNIIGFAVAGYILRREIGVELKNTLIYLYRFYPEFFNQHVRPLLNRKPDIDNH